MDEENRPGREDYTDEDQLVLTDMPTLPRPYKITEYIRKFMLRGHKIEGRTDYEADLHCPSAALSECHTISHTALDGLGCSAASHTQPHMFRDHLSVSYTHLTLPTNREV